MDLELVVSRGITMKTYNIFILGSCFLVSISSCMAPEDESALADSGHMSADSQAALVGSDAALLAGSEGDPEYRELLDALADSPHTSSITPYIIAQHSYKCLDVAGASSVNGADIWQWECDGSANQRWRLQYAGGGYFYLVAQHSGKCAEVAWASMVNGANVRQWDCRDDANQRWRLQYAGSGYFYLVAQHSGKCLEIAWSSPANGATAWQWECDGDSNQTWLIRW